MLLGWMNHLVTIRDVAKYAGVSVATVSRVLNNKGQVSKATREKVSTAIQELNYRPNLVARTLYKKNSSMIGLILPDIMNPFFPALARAVEDRALSYGYTVVLCNADGSTEKELTYIESLGQKYVDGIIISTSQLTVESFSQFDMPIVALDRYIKNDIPIVFAENEHGAVLATEHLLQQMCKHIVHIRGPKGITTADQRENGFLNKIRQTDADYTVIETDFNVDTAEEDVYQLLKMHPSIDGVFAGSDLIAIGVMKAARRLDISIPDDLQLVGFDGIQFGEMLYPSLTTIKQPVYDMGTLAVDLLHQQIKGEKLETFNYKFPVELLKRKTTKGRED